MLGSLMIGGAIVLATALVFMGMFIRFGQGWNGGLGNGAYKRKR